MRKPPGFTFYRGPSALDGKPIIAIATLKSGNRKTGSMIQTWILPADIEPHVATKTGADASVCGDCPLRPSATGVCYVLTFNGPLAIYRAYARGSYPDLSNDLPAMSEYVNGRMVRMGAYGDPAAVPQSAWESLLRTAKGHTGYTHQWRAFPWLKGHVQASCDNATDVREAKAAGWKVFALVPRDTSRQAYQDETGTMFHDCPAVTGRTCGACGLCNGARADVIIDVHGSRAGNLK